MSNTCVNFINVNFIPYLTRLEKLVKKEKEKKKTCIYDSFKPKVCWVVLVKFTNLRYVKASYLFCLVKYI